MMAFPIGQPSFQQAGSRRAVDEGCRARSTLPANDLDGPNAIEDIGAGVTAAARDAHSSARHFNDDD
jgi:hypothetical protein